ncbi:MAG TPA: fibronectin type III domain-containing protein [Thermoanaerobaculia bacterium]
MSTSVLVRRPLVSVFLLIAFFAGLFKSDSALAAYGVPVPSQLRLTVRETAGIARSGEVVRSGVPIPRSLDLRSTAPLAVVDASGTPVPADFQVTARWNAGLDNTSAPIQWLLVSFPATVSANASATYRIVTDGSIANPAPARPLRLTRNGDAITVETGAAIFRFGASSGALFDEVLLDDGTRLINGGSLTLQSNGASAGHPTTRKIWIEHEGPLFTAVVIKGAYDMPPVGNGGIGSIRRYEFRAGSSTAIVRHAVAWEGILGCQGCTKTTAGTPNGVKLDQVRDALTVELGGAAAVTAVGDFDSPAVTGGGPASVRQLLRASRTAPLRFEAQTAGGSTSGDHADGGVLAASGPRGAVAIALRQMHRYEPQALHLLPDGSLAVDVAGDQVWLAHHQGLFGTLAVSALPSGPSRADLDRRVWAPLNRPLRAWADSDWFAASGAVDEIPVGPLPASLASYDTLIPSVLNRTIQQNDLLGLSGLTTFGVYPRYWGKDGAPGEIECSATNDPTPNETWDNKFWCTTWTDYHNAAATVPIWAMRSGEVEWLDELAVPAALRTLHTQIMQCSPTEKWFYCGQAPAGYGGYRLDFNSSHAYFDNLYLYYWLTGDSTVIEILRRGGETMRRHMCDTRGPKPVIEPVTGPGGPRCGPDHISTGAKFYDRVAAQWLSALRFLGLASPDGTFLEDFSDGLARAATQNYVEVHKPGESTAYGFLGERAVVPGTYLTGHLWQYGLLDSNVMFRLQLDTGDAPIGNPALPPSRIMAAVTRMLNDIEPTVDGDGSITGSWPQYLQYSYLDARIGGVLSTVAPAPNDRSLYTPEKACFTALFLRSGEQTNDASLLARGEALVQQTLTAATNDRVPLGKLHGQYLSRLHAAIARLTNTGGTPPPPPPPPTAPAAPSSLVAQALSQGEIQLTWADNSDNEESFRVEQSVNGSFQEIRSLPAGSASTRMTGLTAGATYTFRVRAANTAGFSGYSNTASDTTPAPLPTPPAAPGSLAAQALSGTEIQLTWQDNSGNEDSFRVEQSINGIFQEIRSLPAGSTSTRVTGLTADTTYTFRVRAANTAGFSSYSNVASDTTPAPLPTPPAAPGSLVAQALSGTEIQLTWQDNSGNEDSFRVEQSINGVFQEIRSLPAGSISTQVTGLTADTTYTFRVRAANTAGFSGYSNVASDTTPASPAPTVPAAPSNLVAQVISSTEIRLTWADNSANEDNFRVEQLISGTFTQIQIPAANVTTTRVGGLKANTTYTFRVRAKNAAGYSGYSNNASVTTPKKNPNAPGSLRAVAVSATIVALTWVDNSTNETELRIEKQVNGVYREIRRLGANQTSARIAGLAPGTTYSFRVRAGNAEALSAYSNVARTTTRGRAPSTAVDAPSRLTGRWTGGGNVLLQWQDNSDNETKFHIYRMVNGVYQEVLTVRANQTSVRVTGLRTRASYNFRVRASRHSTYSDYSRGTNINTF